MPVVSFCLFKSDFPNQEYVPVKNYLVNLEVRIYHIKLITEQNVLVFYSYTTNKLVGTTVILPEHIYLIMLREEPLFFWRGLMRNLQAQTIFFQLQARKQFIFQATVLQTIFFLRNAMLYYEECYVTSLVLPLTNNIGGPVFMLPYLSAVVPEYFCCLHISAFNLSSTCLLASLITSSLQSTQYFIHSVITVDWCNFDTSILTGNALS